MTPPAVAAGVAAILGYEKLRGHVLAQTDTAGAAGLGVLMRRGMRAWIEASSATAPSPLVANLGVERAPARDGMRDELARLMVTMALGAAEQEART